MVVGILWLPVLLQVQGSEFWAYSQSISSFLLPPIVVTFVMGIFWPRTTEKVGILAVVPSNTIIYQGVLLKLNPDFLLHCTSRFCNLHMKIMLHQAITANAHAPRSWLIDVSGCVQRAGGWLGLWHHPHGSRVVDPATGVRQWRGEPAV